MSFVRPTESIFKSQLEFLRQYADLRPVRTAEILAQLDTPVPFLGSITFLRAGRSQWTLELLSATFRLAQFVDLRIKHALACRRPIEYSAQVQPIILTPGHGSLPSGHATESFAMAVVLSSLLEASSNTVYHDQSFRVQLLRQAARIAINRSVAGVHFPVDSVAGAVLGVTLGQYFVRRSNKNADQTYSGSAFNGMNYPGHRDFDWTEIFEFDQGSPISVRQQNNSYLTDLTQQNMPFLASPLSWLWAKALGEWR
jgi:membrane-associated phospholipid phosphatase